MSKLNFDAKVEKYKQALKYPFWTLSEAEYYLSGNVEFYWFYHLHPIERKIFDRHCFGLLPMREEYADGKLEKEILHALETKETSLFKDSDIITKKKGVMICRRPKHITKIKPGPIEKLILETEEGANQFKHKITLFSLKLRGGVEYSCLGKFMYFFDPHEFIALAVTEGIKLPLELQKATGLFQTYNSKPLSESSKKQVMRQAIAQAFWHKYPDFSISEITRRFSKLKNFYGNSFGFINESVNRNREVIRALQPKDSKPVLLLPGIVQKNDGILAFNFQKLKIAVNIIAYLLIRTNNKITENEILSHPLIGSYINLGGDKLKYIIEYSLREALSF